MAKGIEKATIVSSAERIPLVERATPMLERFTATAIGFADRTMQIVAAFFILTTSFLFVRGWLQQNQANHDFSLAGAILILSVVTYLIVRPRR